MPLNNKSIGFETMKRKTKRVILRLLVIILILWIIARSPACRDLYGSLYIGDSCLCCPSGPPPILGGWIAADPQFLWMPSGKEIMYQNQSGEIFLVYLDEGESPQPDRLEVIGFQPDVTKDGKLLAVNTSEHLVKIYLLPDLRQVESVPNAFDFKWRPDNQVLAIGSLDSRENTLIYLVSIEDPAPRTLVVGSGRPLYYLEGWSRDGNYLALTESVPDPIARGIAEKLFVLSIDSGSITPLINLPGCQKMLSWSPVENQVVFAANPDNRWDLLQIGLGGDQARNLTNTPDEIEYQPEWSPGGKSIAYVTFKQTGDLAIEQDIYVVNVTTLEKQRLTNTGDEYESLPRWSPDGGRIAYLSVLDNVWYLNIMNSDGTGQKRLAVIGGYK
jgi:hypothetical protein